MKKQMAFLVIVGLFFSCSNDDDVKPQTIDMRINHYQNTGLAVGPVMTLLVQKGDDIGTEKWTRFYADIEGFDYVPGKIYNLSVMVEQIDNPPADGSSLKYTLLGVKSVQEVDKETLFAIDLKINGQSFISITPDYKLLSQISIDCNTLCDELAIKVQNQDFVVGTFKRLTNNEIQLVDLE